MVLELSDQDKHKYMLRCIELAKQASTEMRKPHVGALVISPQGDVVGEGYKTFIEGTKMISHAERNAIDQAVYNTDGSTLITTLEPCVKNKSKRLGRLLKSCSELIVESGISRVIYGVEDNSRVVNSAEGIRFLKDKGIKVDPFPDLVVRIVDELMTPEYQDRAYWSYEL